MYKKLKSVNFRNILITIYIIKIITFKSIKIIKLRVKTVANSNYTLFIYTIESLATVLLLVLYIDI